MSYPSNSFKELLWALAYAEGRNPDPAAGDLDINANWTGQTIAHLSRAIDDFWRPSKPDIAWPSTVDAKSVTPTAGKFQRSDIAESDWFSVWSEDPRPLFASGDFYSHLRLRAVEDASGIVVGNGPSSVFVFYRLPAPEFTQTAVNTGSTYNTVGTLVYDAAGTGHVYKSKATGALGNALTDTDKWTKQTVPVNLVKMLIYRAEAYRAEAKSNPEMAADKHAKADAEFQAEIDRVSPKLNEWPLWLWRGV